MVSQNDTCNVLEGMSELCEICASMHVQRECDPGAGTRHKKFPV